MERPQVLDQTAIGRGIPRSSAVEVFVWDFVCSVARHCDELLHFCESE